jgi:pimeloyl-ACP methyl ester carboxylesterase
MDTHETRYAEVLGQAQLGLLEYLRTFESIQENLRLRAVRESQARLVQSTGDTFRRFAAEFAELTPPEHLREFHLKFREAAALLERSMTLFLTAPSPQWTLAFLHSRSHFCSALYLLYDLRGELPSLRRYFVTEGSACPADDAPSDRGGKPVGFIHRERDQNRSDYSLYVPENYSPEQNWPLIICLHGGYGQGNEYIFTWLRPARCKGYILLSPKSIVQTWTMTLESPDTRSILRMVEEVAAEYSIDRSRIYLTGLSDGGIFTYIMGLEHHHMFAGIAPVAGALHLLVQPILREGAGRDLPIYVIHGAHDFIFPVQLTRQTCAMLKELGYNLRYDELPEWGHAYPYSINERMVMPWFEQLPPTPRQSPDS